MATESIRHQAAIAGVVTITPTGAPLAGARVALLSSPQAFSDRLAVLAALAGPSWDDQDPRPDRARTSADGRYVFIDLPSGAYAVSASLLGGGSRYGTAGAQVTVARDASGRIAVATADLAVPATSVSGKVTAPPPPPPPPAPGGTTPPTPPAPPAPVPIVMAEVRIQGSGERSYSDGQGKYLLAGIEAGARVITVTLAGHAPANRPVVLSAAGVSPTVDVTLSADELAKPDPNVTRSAANG